MFLGKNYLQFLVLTFFYSLDEYKIFAVRRLKRCAVICYLIVKILIWERCVFTFLPADVGIKPQCSGLKTNP